MLTIIIQLLGKKNELTAYDTLQCTRCFHTSTRSFELHNPLTGTVLFCSQILWVRHSDKVPQELLISALQYLCPRLGLEDFRGWGWISWNGRSTAKMTSLLTCLALWRDNWKARLHWNCHLSTYTRPFYQGGLRGVIRLLGVFLLQKPHVFHDPASEAS